jgi:hypothetical protein
MKQQPEISIGYDQLLALIDVPIITRFIPLLTIKDVIQKFLAE